MELYVGPYCGHVIPASLLTLPPVDSGNHCSHYKMSSRMPLYFESLPQSQRPREEHSRLCCPYSVAKLYLAQQPTLSVRISQARILEGVAISFSRDSRLCFGQILIPYLASGEWDKNIFFFKEIFFYDLEINFLNENQGPAHSDLFSLYCK